MTFRTLWCDFETGGFEADVHSPLSVAFIAAEGRNIIGKWYVQLRQEPLVVTREALRVNGLDLLADGLTYEQFRTEYKVRMGMWFFGGIDKSGGFVERPSMANMPMFGGQNCPFDRSFLQAIMGKYYYTSYHNRDVMAAAALAIDGGKISLPNLKLDSIAEALGLSRTSAVHSAEEDVQLAFDCWWRLADT
jgi:hypothetical protein